MPKEKYQEYLDLVNQIKKEKKYREPTKLLKQCWNYKDVGMFALHILSTEKHADENPALPDYLALYDIPFTMEEYDIDGKKVFYNNKKLDLCVEVTHKNRYKNMASLEDIEIYQSGCWRNDISYLE